MFIILDTFADLISKFNRTNEKNSFSNHGHHGIDFM